jgi:hypothetical protein
MATKKVEKQFFSPFSFVAVFGSEIRNSGWTKIRIRDKHPGSATLLSGDYFLSLFVSFNIELGIIIAVTFPEPRQKGKRDGLPRWRRRLSVLCAVRPGVRYEL